MKTKTTSVSTSSQKTMAGSSTAGWATRLLLWLLLFTLPAALQAQFDYTTQNSHITIIRYTGLGGAVDIPNTINGRSVTRIGNEAFFLQSSLTSITIPNSVTSIGDSTFAYCTSLTSITIPDSVSSIGSGTFRGCTNLSAITVDQLNAFFSGVDGVLYDKNLTTLIQCPEGTSGTFTILNSVTSIRTFAFIRCTSLTSIIIGNSVTSIEAGAFRGCSSLTSPKTSALRCAEAGFPENE